jgi:hypothetical protein
MYIASSRSISAARRYKRFVAEYQSNGMNATEAALSAGFQAKSRHSAEVIGNQLLTKPEIRQQIETDNAARLQRLGITADDVVRGLWELVTVRTAEQLFSGKFSLTKPCTDLGCHHDPARNAGPDWSAKDSTDTGCCDS